MGKGISVLQRTILELALRPQVIDESEDLVYAWPKHADIYIFQIIRHLVGENPSDIEIRNMDKRQTPHFFPKDGEAEYRLQKIKISVSRALGRLRARGLIDFALCYYPEGTKHYETGEDIGGRIMPVCHAYGYNLTEKGREYMKEQMRNYIILPDSQFTR